jgi:hypothetical protein
VLAAYVLMAATGFALTQLAIWQGRRRPMVGILWFGANAVLAAAVSAWGMAGGQWLLAAWMGFCAALNAWMAWEHWNRRKRKRAAALAGAKSRARVAALVRKAREAARPRKVLRPVRGGAAVALCAALLSACGPAQSVTPGTPSPPATAAPRTAQAPSSTPAAPHCGLERWPVKTGTDADAGKVDLSAVQPTTIAHLAALAAPPVLPQASRIPPVEVTVYQVTATLAGWKIEADRDVHAVLSGGTQTMIVELPDPACAAGSRFLPQITAARNAFDTQFHPSDVWRHAGGTVTVTGVGFWDFPHGQTGVAANAIELHPVLGIQFGAAATP